MPSFFCMPLGCNRQVDSIDRRQANLQQVPHEIARYARTLEELLLAMNHIKELPKELYRLTRLRILDLSDNDIYKVSSEISQLAALEELNLSRNDISDLPDEIRLCKALMRLELSSNPFTRLPAAVSQLDSLVHLGLNDISLTQLPQDIGSLVNLRSLEARDNLIRVLPHSICKLSKLQVLDLGQNEIDLLPSEIGHLVSLREFYVDDNDLEILPDQIVACRSLEQLDVSVNKLQLLPHDLGLLEALTDINVSQNCLGNIPDTIGRLRKLSIVKAEKNAISALPMSIGNCDNLQELSLTENLLTDIPSSIGNLRQLKSLNLDKNQLTAIPTTIGGCSSLTVLSLRDNLVSELPMDIGKCSHLSVLDLCRNQASPLPFPPLPSLQLSFLPFTIKVLDKLKALWLTENQSQAILKLQEDHDPRTRVKVLTCYLLPQHAAEANPPERRVGDRSFVGGPKVHFPDDRTNTTVDNEADERTGQFSRHDTPHPKPSDAKKNKKNTIDGHVIHHEEDHDNINQPPTLSLKKKPSMDATSPSGSTGQPSMPRSAIKQYAQPERSPSTVPAAPSLTSLSHTDNNNREDAHRSVLFSSSTKSSPEDESGPVRLKRMNTPHYKSIRSSATDPSTGPKVRRIRVARDSTGNLGLSIAGGLESTPFKDDDRGIFVSRVQEGGPAERAGLRVGDKLLRVGEVDVLSCPHETAVRAMQECREGVELSVLRLSDDKVPKEGQRTSASPVHTPDVSFSSEADTTKETITVSLRRDLNGSPGFAISGGVGGGRDGIFISKVTKGGPADLDGKIQVGDRVLSIDGTKMKDTRHDQAVALLTGLADKEVHLLVQRDPSTTPLLSPLPSTPIVSAIRTPSPASSPVYNCGDPSWDGRTETVDLRREGASLGLSVVGGSDHVSHPFGVAVPGVFISKIAAGSAADRSRRLRVGDRILKVNDIDVQSSTHSVAVDALKASGSRVRLLVIHDPQPGGMKEVMVRRRGDGPLGISIHGGVRAPPANPRDPKDEGIFIDKVEGGSISESAGLLAGQRIVEVNGESLLGATQNEAASALKRPHELRLLVCDGYNSGTGASALPGPPSSSTGVPATSASSTAVNRSSSSLAPASPPPPPSPILSAHELSSSVVADLQASELAAPLATSSPLPAPTAIKPSRLPPPVAPKPSMRTSQASAPISPVSPSPEVENDNPERLAFSSKISNFEKKIEMASNGKVNGINGRPNNLHPEKISLLNQDDIMRMKEAEARKIIASPAVLDSPDNNTNFDEMINAYSAIPRPGSIRTKKAENRAIEKGLIPDDSVGISEAERIERESAKREQWRKDRMASLANNDREVDALFREVVPTLKNIMEEKTLPADEIEYADAEL